MCLRTEGAGSDFEHPRDAEPEDSNVVRGLERMCEEEEEFSLSGMSINVVIAHMETWRSHDKMTRAGISLTNITVTVYDDELCIYIPLQANYNVLRRGGRQPAVRRTGAPVGSRCVRGSVVSL